MSNDDVHRKTITGGSPVIGAPGSLTTLGGQNNPQSPQSSGTQVRTTQTYVEQVIQDATPGVKITQTYVEVVVERDYVWIDFHVVEDPSWAE